VLIGAIAISVAIGAGGGRADASGALSQIARTPGGTVLLWVVVVGLFALGLWQIVHAVLASDGDSAKRWARRVGDISKAVV
jgi:threonine/homoserine/homoserine lactone efflux protein